MLSQRSLILTQGILFLIFLVVTACFNSLAADDYYYLGAAKEKPFWEYYSFLYQNWNGRWASNFILVGLFSMLTKANVVALYTLCSIGLVITSILFLVKTLNKKLNLSLSKSEKWSYSLIFMSVLFFCFPNPNEVWFWLTSNSIYLISIGCGIALIAVAIKNQIQFSTITIATFSVLYIGGSNEPLAMFLLVALGILCIIKKNKVAAVSMVILAVSFAFNIFCEGTSIRNNLQIKLGLIDTLLYSGYSTVQFLFFNFHKSFLPAIFLAIPFYALGTKSNVQIALKPFKALLYTSILITGIVFLNSLITVYAISSTAPARALSTSSLLIALIICSYFFLLGNSTQLKLQNTLYANSIGLIVLIIGSTITHSNYTKALNERFDFISTNEQKTIEVQKLPNAGFIYSAETTTDTNHYLNQHLMYGLDKEGIIKLTED